MLQPKTKLVVVNFPHNPTGAVASREMWEGIMAACRAVGSPYLFSDEMYRFLGGCLRKGFSLGVLACDAAVYGAQGDLKFMGWTALVALRRPSLRLHVPPTAHAAPTHSPLLQSWTPPQRPPAW